MNSLRELNVYSTSSVIFTDQTLGPSQVLANRYQINGLLDTSRPVLENIEKMCSAAGSWLSYDIHEGKWGVVINQSGTSIVSFNDSNIIGNISVSGTGLQDLYNSIKVEFPHRELKDSADFITIEIPAGQRNANEEDNILNISYDIINDPVQANLLGLIELKQSRIDLVIRFVTDYSYINLKAGDIVDVTDSRFGFTNKIFRIVSITEVQDDDGALMMEITALEYNSDVYSTANLYKYTRTDKNGIITIGSIGTPGTPQVTRYQIDARPRLIIESLSPTGIVDGLEYWLSTDVGLPEANRTYNLIGVKTPPNGSTYPSGTNVILDYDNLDSGNFVVKTRGYNSVTYGPYSSPSGLVVFTSTQVTNAIGPNTGVLNSLGTVATIYGAYQLMKGVDELYQKVANTGSLFTKIFDTLNDVTGIDLRSSSTVATLEGLSIQDEGTTLTTVTNKINFIGDGVTASYANKTVTVNIPAVGYTGSQGIQGVIGYTGSIGIGFTGSRGVTGATGSPGAGGYTGIQNQYFDIYATRPVSKSKPVSNAVNYWSLNSNTAATTGSYFISFGAPYQSGQINADAFPQFITSLTKVSGKNIYLYKSDGTLVETVTSNNCTLYSYNWGNYFVEFPNLVTYDAVLEIPFSTRDYGVDYYILMEEGIITYCGTYKSPSIDNPTTWAFRTANFYTPNFSQIGDGLENQSGVNASIVYRFPNNQTAICANSLTNLIIKYDKDIILQDNDPVIALYKFNGISASPPYSLVTATNATASLIDTKTLKITPNSIISTAITSTNTTSYFISIVDTLSAGFPWSVSPRTKLQSIDCGYSYGTVEIPYISPTIYDSNHWRIDLGSGTGSPTLSTSTVISAVTTDSGKLKTVKNTTISLTYNRFVTFTTGTFIIYDSTGTIHQTINSSDTFEANKVSGLVDYSTTTNNTITLNPTKDFIKGNTYYLNITTGTIVDLCGNKYGLTSTSTVRWTIDSGPSASISGPTSITRPVTTSNSAYTLTFDRNIEKISTLTSAGYLIDLYGGEANTGSVVIRNSSGVSVGTTGTNLASALYAQGTTANFNLASMGINTAGTYSINIERNFVRDRFNDRDPCISQSTLTSVTIT